MNVDLHRLIRKDCSAETLKNHLVADPTLIYQRMEGQTPLHTAVMAGRSGLGTDPPGWELLHEI